MLDAALTAQLRTHFEKITRPVELVAALDDSPKARELAELLGELAALSDRVTVVQDPPRRGAPACAARRSPSAGPAPTSTSASPASRSATS